MLQLHPADMGRIRVKLNFNSDGSVQGTVVADNPATLDALLKDVRSLERSLQDAGLRADPGSLKFSLGGQQQDTGAQQNANSNASNGNDNNLPAAENDDTSLALAATTDTYILTPGRVNLSV